MRLDAEHRREAIAAAEVHVLNAQVGRPEFLATRDVRPQVKYTAAAVRSSGERPARRG
jgi:hypothetical protein